MSSLKQSSNFCVFCYRNSNTFANKISADFSIKKFLKFVGRFVSDSKNCAIFKHCEKLLTSEILPDSLFNSCEDCKSIFESFCEQYHQLKCLELQLEWKLDKLVKIIKLANLVPSRATHVIKNLDELFVDDKLKREISYKSVTNLRRTITKAGHLRKRKSLPRVLLTNVENCNLTVLSKMVAKINEEFPQNEDLSMDSEDYYEELSLDDDADITDQINLDTVMGLEPSADHHKITKVETLTEKNCETATIISNIPSISISPTPQPIIEYVIINTLSTNGIQNCSIKTELVNNIADQTESTSESDILEDNTTPSLHLDDKQLNKVSIKANQTEESDDSLKSPTVSATIKQQRYSLREKCTPKLENLDATISDHDHDDESYMEHSDSSVSEDSISETDLQLTKKQGPKTGNLATQLKRLQQRGHIMCCSDGCRKSFRTKDSYISHMKLHSSGKFPCNFCDTMETNLVKLCFHEYETHSTPENLAKDNNKPKNHSWSCPRCTNKTFISCKTYLAHFSFTHFGIGKEPMEQIPKSKQLYIPTQKRKGKEKFNHEIINGVVQFRCKFCKLPFPKLDKMRRHIREYHCSNSTIPNCEKEGESSQTSENVENFKCNFCDLTFKYAPDLAIHELEHAVAKPTEKISKRKAMKKSKCPRCPFLYTLKGVYIKHHLKAHLNLLSGDYPGACKLCSGPDVYIPNREKHYDIFHNTALLEDPTKIFKCEYENCSAYFVKALQLLQHNNFIHLKNNHKCEICDKIFKTRLGLMGHKKMIHKKYDEDPSLPLACDRDGCPKRFKSEGELELHKTYHRHTDKSKERSKCDVVDEHDLVCAECGKVCKSSESLTIHQKNVHREKSFVCPECGKAFKNKCTLDTHLVYHKGPDEWKFECEECGKKCADKYKLKSHMNTHSKEKPWICQFCGEKYAHRHNWRNHLKVKHGDEEGAQEDIKGMFMKTGCSISRKGSKKGDCILAGVVAEER